MSKDAHQESQEQADFRAYCRDWLEENLPPPPPSTLPQTAIELIEKEHLDYLCAWQKAAYEAGLVGCDYDKAYGGGGHSGFQRIANQEMQRLETPYFPNIIGLGMAGPTLYFHASDALKASLLPKLLSGEEIWCQGFSEPGAGSDLSNVQTFAEQQGDEWIINGHKTWTSLAHCASWMIMLARTEKSDKYGGLTYFVVPIKSALGQGVSIKPLIKATGGAGFNEVLFEHLKIHDAYRLDGIGKGWQVAMTTLTHERGAGPLVTPSAGGAGRKEAASMSGVRDLIDLARRAPRDGGKAIDDPVIRDELMKLIIRDTGFTQSMRLSSVEGLTENPIRLPTQVKLVITELMQDAAELAMQIEGPSSSLYIADPLAPEEGRWPLAYLNSFAGTIAAGSNEIQRNILGERVLGLPKSK